MLNFLTANISPDGLRDHKAEKSHVLKPCGIVGHAASASLQGTCGSSLQRRPLCLASTACSTIAQLRANLQPATFHDLVDRRCRNPEQTRRSGILRPARTRTHEERPPSIFFNKLSPTLTLQESIQTSCPSFFSFSAMSEAHFLSW